MPQQRTGFTRIILLMTIIVAVLGGVFLWLGASPRPTAPPSGYSTGP
jgi:hypothetical protein